MKIKEIVFRGYDADEIIREFSFEDSPIFRKLKEAEEKCRKKR